MPYNNLIYFLVVILILTTNATPDQPQFSFFPTISFFLIKLTVFRFLLTKIFSRLSSKKVESYAGAERQGSILAIVCFALDVYLLDCQYYFSQFPLAKNLPVITSCLGIGIFSLYLSILWAAAQKSYQDSFGRIQSVSSFIYGNLKTNLPIILPWLSISLLADLLQIAPFPAIHKVLQSPWGEPIIFLFFFAILITIFPVLITRLWGCTPLPDGAVRERIESFCKKENVQYREIMLWPLFEGHALTAGVMGFIKNFRYFLITPALIRALTVEELEAVMAHEIGHVRKRHLQLYLFIFLGFGLLSQFFSYPLLSLLADSDLFYRLVHFTGKEPGNTLALASTVPTFFLMIFYFRFVMGYFMRNFERQADLYALKSIKSCRPIVQVFEKIAWLSGNTRDMPSWHHFSISQRIDCLKEYSLNPALISQHDRKVHISLLALLAIFLISAFLIWQAPNPQMSGSSREKFAVAALENKISQSPQKAPLYQLLGDLQYSRKKYPETIDAYKRSLQVEPDNFEVLNNLAWLYLTVKESSLRDPAQALELARKASILKQSPYILDTLALAYWQNGYPDRAITTIKKALAQNPADLQYYRLQLRKFQSPPAPL